jgi:hypothetical protein
VRAMAFSSFVAAKTPCAPRDRVGGRAIRRTALPCRMVSARGKLFVGRVLEGYDPSRSREHMGVLCPVALVLAGCDDAPGEWAAIVYPDRTDRTRSDVTSRFKTSSYCRDQAIERMKAIQIKSGGDYECGFQCPATRIT